MQSKQLTDALLHAVRPALRRRGKIAAVFSLAAALAFGSHAMAADGVAAPDFALRSTDGKNFRLSEFRGEVVLLSFWAQWCGECRQALDELDEIYAKYNRAGLVMLGVNVDESREGAASAARNLKLSFPVLMDEHKDVSASYRLQSMPLVVLIDRDGTIRYSHAGYRRGDEQQWSEQVRLQLNQ